jgi:hypothetical protein
MACHMFPVPNAAKKVPGACAVVDTAAKAVSPTSGQIMEQYTAWLFRKLVKMPPNGTSAAVNTVLCEMAGIGSA